MAPPRTGQDGPAGKVDPALPRPGGVHDDQGRRVRADLGDPVAGAARSWCSTRSRSAGCRPRSGGTRSRAALMRRWRSGGLTGSRTRSACPAPRIRRSGAARPAATCAACSTPPRWPAATCAWSPGGRWAAPRMPSRSWQTGRRRAVGAGAGGAARRGAEDGRHGQDGAVPRAGVHDRSGAGAVRPARRRRRVRHRGVPARSQGRCT